MPERDFNDATKYIGVSAELIGLRDWDFRLMKVPAEPNVSASCQCLYGQKYIRVWLCDDWNTLSEYQKRTSIAHELTHAHFDDSHEMVAKDLRPLLSKQSHDVFYEAFNRQFEHGIDAVATYLAKLLPTYPRMKRIESQAESIKRK